MNQTDICNMALEAIGSKASPFTRTTLFECKRCGLCCQGRGDFAFDLDDVGGEHEPYDCTALKYEGGVAVCRMEECKRDCCREYPGDEWCQRELIEKGLWRKYIAP